MIWGYPYFRKHPYGSNDFASIGWFLGSNLIFPGGRGDTTSSTICLTNSAAWVFFFSTLRTKNLVICYIIRSYTAHLQIHTDDNKPIFFRISMKPIRDQWNVMFTLDTGTKTQPWGKDGRLGWGQFSKQFFRSIRAAYLNIYGVCTNPRWCDCCTSMCIVFILYWYIYIYYDVDIWTCCSLKILFWTFCDVQGSAAKLNLTARALSEPAAGEMERAGENDVCQFIFHDSFSANGSLLVWGPVFWIPGIPLWKRLLLKGTRFESRTSGPQTNN